MFIFNSWWKLTLWGLALVAIGVLGGRWTKNCPSRTKEVKTLETRIVSLKEGMKVKEDAYAASFKKTSEKKKICPAPPACPTCQADVSGELKTCQEAKTKASDELITCQEKGVTLLSALEGLREKTGVQCVLHTGEGFPETPRGVYYKPAGVFKGTSSTVICWWKRHGSSNATTSTSTSTPPSRSNGRLGKLEGKVAKLDTRVRKVEIKAADNSKDVGEIQRLRKAAEKKRRAANILLQAIAKKAGLNTSNL